MVIWMKLIHGMLLLSCSASLHGFFIGLHTSPSGYYTSFSRLPIPHGHTHTFALDQWFHRIHKKPSLRKESVKTSDAAVRHSDHVCDSLWSCHIFHVECVGVPLGHQCEGVWPPLVDLLF